MCLDYLRAFWPERDGQVAVHHYSAGNMDLWNEEIRYGTMGFTAALTFAAVMGLCTQPIDWPCPLAS